MGPINKLYQSRYREIRTIGSGTSGRAILVHDTKHNQYLAPQFLVLKEIIRPDYVITFKERIQAKREVEILRDLHHSNIIRYMDSFEECGYLYIVTEFANRGDLYGLIKDRRANNLDYLLETVVKAFFFQLCIAVKYLHSRQILHRDIKTRNIFLSLESPSCETSEDHSTDIRIQAGDLINATLKVGDFGIARSLDGTDLAKTVIGTPYYLSPEICENKPYSYKSDIWSVGCVLYEMLTLKHAFDAQSMRSLVNKIVNGIFSPIPSIYTKECQDLIVAILQKDPEKRPSIDEILRSAWLKNHDPELNDLHDKYDVLLKHFGVDQSFQLMVQHLLGPAKISDVMQRYQWHETDSHLDVLEHILSDKRSYTSRPKMQPIDIIHGSQTQNKPVGRSSCCVYVPLDSHTYLFEGEPYEYGVFYTSQHSKCRLDLAVSPAQSLHGRIERLKDYLQERMGKDAFLALYQLCQSIQLQACLDWQSRLQKTLGALVFEYYKQNDCLFLVWQLIIHEEKAYGRLR